MTAVCKKIPNDFSNVYLIVYVNPEIGYDHQVSLVEFMTDTCKYLRYHLNQFGVEYPNIEPDLELAMTETCKVRNIFNWLSTCCKSLTVSQIHKRMVLLRTSDNLRN